MGKKKPIYSLPFTRMSDLTKNVNKIVDLHKKISLEKEDMLNKHDIPYNKLKNGWGLSIEVSNINKVLMDKIMRNKKHKSMISELYKELGINKV